MFYIVNLMSMEKFVYFISTNRILDDYYLPKRNENVKLIYQKENIYLFSCNKSYKNELEKTTYLTSYLFIELKNKYQKLYNYIVTLTRKLSNVDIEIIQIYELILEYEKLLRNDKIEILLNE